MHVAIVRHGEAEDGTQARDRDRHLTARGRAEISQLAEALSRFCRKNCGGGRTKILCSPYTRTCETAGVLAEGLGVDAATPVRELAAGVNARLALNIGADYSEGIDTLIMVGHAPDVDDVAATFAPEGTETSFHFRPGCCAMFECSGEPAPRRGVFVAFFDPRALPSTS